MSPIVSPELVNKVLDVEVDCGFGDQQLICDLLVAITVANQPENLSSATILDPPKE
jgi:hypothetical protein